ncbi:MAG: tetratricopeptide repeat protein [Bacteroidales bacterium]|nr:tetratricopeptide repeat protein [Bacteroidales bacterium]
MKILKSSLLTILFLTGFLTGATAQRTENFKSPQYEFKTAMDLFSNEKYGSAQQYFKQVYENTTDMQQDLRTNSYFYMGVCAERLDNPDAAYLLQGFIDRYPVHSYVPEARFYLGRHYFSRKQWKKVIVQYDLIYENEIQPENVAEYQFKKGYSYFMTNEYERAKAMFKQARESSGPYKLRSIYYLAYMAYQDGQYEAALEDFLLLKDEPEYSEEVPAFLTQIYFKQGDYEKVLAVAPPITSFNDPAQMRTLRCVAISQYALNQYDDAANNFDKLLASEKIALDRNDNFAAGFSFYRTARYADAVNCFSKCVNDKKPDAMTQNSYYLIGDCYRRDKQENLAIQAFKEASKLDFNKDIQEDALYNYAKLQCQTSTSPFNNGIEALQEYSNRYPHSARSEEVSSYLSKLYLSTKNYQAAINSIEKLSSKSPEILRAYQRCTYFRALELINNRNYTDALKTLEKTLGAPIDKDINLNALYWKGESQYRSEKYQDAYYTLQTYQKSANATFNENYVNSLYTLGYAALKIKRYRDATTYFKNYLSKYGKADERAKQADATARLADCYFMQQDLNNAIKYYDQCERLGEANADYAVYQLAKCYGYQKNNAKKIAALERLNSNYTHSAYRDDAEYDLAVTYHTQNNFDQAIQAYKSFIQKHPKSQHVRQAHTRLAQAYMNSGNTSMAISTYKYVVETYPGSQEAKDALANLETIYTEEGNTSEFFDYIRTKNMNISADRQDSIAFRAAETKYNRGDCDGAVRACAEYLRQFPNGSFAQKAHFFKAECQYGQRQYDDALVDYEAVVKGHRSEYDVTALHKASSILYNKKQYEKALKYFNKLIESTTDPDEVLYANNGAMRSAYFLKDYSNALTAATNVVNANQSDAELLQEALLVAGNSAKELGQYEDAKQHYKRLANKGTNDLCAEAAYHLADIALNQDHNLKECENQIQNILGSNYSSEYWYARTFILYGDLYKTKGNYFQARHTYQSIVDNYEGEELVTLAREKIAEVEALEAAEDQKNNNKE